MGFNSGFKGLKTPILGIRFHNSPTLVPMLSQIRIL